MMRMTMEGVRAPEISGEEGDWINSPPLRLKNLIGQVVLVDFWDYTCVNCIRTLPYIKEWYERYKNWDFTIIGIHTPEFEFAKLRQNVEDAVRRFDIKYPVLLDSNRVNWDNFTNRYWPRHLLIDTQRRIVHDHIGEGGYGETEGAIQREIRRVHPEAVLPERLEPLRPEDAYGAVCYPMTPETYAGFDRGQLGNLEGYQPNVAHTYSDPGRHIDGVIYLRGTWKAMPEALIHVRETPDYEDYLVLRYHAIEVNAVIKPEHGASPFDVYIQQNDRPLTREDAGEDVKFLDNGEAYIRVDTPRMYNLVRNRIFDSYELKLSTSSDAFGIYAFTFGSCTKAD